MIFFLYVLLSEINYSANEVWVEVYEKGRIINAKGNCTLKGENFEIKADSALIFESENLDSAYLYKNIKVESRKLSIFSDKVFYNFINSFAIFEKNVKIESDTYMIKTDKVFYSDLKDSAFADSKVSIKDKIRNIEIEGFKMVYLTNKKKGKIDSLIGIKIFEEKDTVDIKGKRLLILDKTFFITENVNIISKDFNGFCDTLLWESDIIKLKGRKPELFARDSKLSGKNIEIFLENKKLKRILSKDKSFLKTVSEKKDTLYLYSDFLDIFLDDSLKLEKVSGGRKIEGEIKR